MYQTYLLQICPHLWKYPCHSKNLCFHSDQIFLKIYSHFTFVNMISSTITIINEEVYSSFWARHMFLQNYYCFLQQHHYYNLIYYFIYLRHELFYSRFDIAARQLPDSTILTFLVPIADQSNLYSFAPLIALII